MTTTVWAGTRISPSGDLASPGARGVEHEVRLDPFLLAGAQILDERARNAVVIAQQIDDGVIFERLPAVGAGRRDVQVGREKRIRCGVVDLEGAADAWVERWLTSQRLGYADLLG
jgi:hypothetical protein